MNRLKKWLIHKLGGLTKEEAFLTKQGLELQTKKVDVVTLDVSMHLAKATNEEYLSGKLRLSSELIEKVRPFITYDEKRDVLTASVDVIAWQKEKSQEDVDYEHWLRRS